MRIFLQNENKLAHFTFVVVRAMADGVFVFSKLYKNSEALMAVESQQ